MSDVTDAVSATHGAWNLLDEDQDSLGDWVTSTITDISNVNATVEDQAETLTNDYGSTTPPVVIDPDGSVSVLNWPNEPIVLTNQNAAFAAQVSALLIPLYQALGDTTTAYLLSQRAEQGPTPWEGPWANPWPS